MTEKGDRLDAVTLRTMEQADKVAELIKSKLYQRLQHNRFVLVEIYDAKEIPYEANVLSGGNQVRHRGADIHPQQPHCTFSE